jgi:hypothetical protein
MTVRVEQFFCPRAIGRTTVRCPPSSAYDGFNFHTERSVAGGHSFAQPFLNRIVFAVKPTSRDDVSTVR